MPKRDYYEILGVSRTATEAELKAAFRKLAMQHHPDRNPGDKDCEHRFKELNEAYDVLKDGDKRAAYDRFGHAAFEHGGAGGHGFGSDFASTFADIFDDLFGMGGRRSRGSARERGADLRYNMEVSLEEAFAGKTAQIRIPTPVSCEACSGSGAKAGTGPRSGDRRSVPQLLRLGTRDARTYALRQHSRGRGGRHAHPACRRRRSGCARGPGGRSLYLPVHRIAPVLSARRRRSALPGADLDGGGGARRLVRCAHHRWRQDQGEGARRDSVGTALPPAGQGHAGAPLEAGRRHVRAGRGRNAAEADQAAEGSVNGIREDVLA